MRQQKHMLIAATCFAIFALFSYSTNRVVDTYQQNSSRKRLESMSWFFRDSVLLYHHDAQGALASSVLNSHSSVAAVGLNSAEAILPMKDGNLRKTIFAPQAIELLNDFDGLVSVNICFDGVFPEWCAVDIRNHDSVRIVKLLLTRIDVATMKALLKEDDIEYLRLFDCTVAKNCLFEALADVAVLHVDQETLSGVDPTKLAASCDIHTLIVEGARGPYVVSPQGGEKH